MREIQDVIDSLRRRADVLHQTADVLDAEFGTRPDPEPAERWAPGVGTIERPKVKAQAPPAPDRKGRRTPLPPPPGPAPSAKARRAQAPPPPPAVPAPAPVEDAEARDLTPTEFAQVVYVVKETAATIGGLHAKFLLETAQNVLAGRGLPSHKDTVQDAIAQARADGD